MNEYSSPQKGNNYASTGRIEMSPTPKLDRASESMPRLMGNEDIVSRRSGLSGYHSKLNQSVDLIKPAKRADSSLMKMTGSNILGGNAYHRRSMSNTIDYDIKTMEPATLAKKDPYGQITV